jgi:hypothetical protein
MTFTTPGKRIKVEPVPKTEPATTPAPAEPAKAPEKEPAKV